MTTSSVEDVLPGALPAGALSDLEKCVERKGGGKDGGYEDGRSEEAPDGAGADAETGAGTRPLPGQASARPSAAPIPIRATAEYRERWWSTALQVSVPFFLAGVGTIGAGVILRKAKDLEVFDKVRGLFILIPSLLGLKGNLDMCLASRLSTLANKGEMNGSSDIPKMITGNIALVQVQATVAAVCVTAFAVIVSSISMESFNTDHIALVLVSSIATATISCFFLDLVMITIIMVAYHFNMNPDNLATPMAASIGDVVSLTLFALISSVFYTISDVSIWLPCIVIACYALFLPAWIWIVYRNEYTKAILKSGWVPVLSALMISGFGGLILERVVDQYEPYAVFQPIICGIGGNLVSIQASRISTMLHQTSVPGKIPEGSKLWAGPWTVLVKGVPHAKTSRILFALSVVGQTIFVFAADFASNNTNGVPYQFVLCYLLATSIQVLLLLYLAHFLIHFMWRLKVDPDNSAIPYLTAIGDLTGASFLAGVFVFLEHVLHMPYNK